MKILICDDENKTVFINAFIAILLGTVLLFACLVNHAGKGILFRYDLDGCSLYIHNYTCSGPLGVREVKDQKLFGELADLCTKAVKYQWIDPKKENTKLIMGEFPEPFLEFKNSAVSYTFFLRKDKRPLVEVSKYTRGTGKLESRYYTETWSWHCTLPQRDYAELYELAASYNKGEELADY